MVILIILNSYMMSYENFDFFFEYVIFRWVFWCEKVGFYLGYGINGYIGF